MGENIMTLFERIKKLADERKISITQLQEDLGMSKNYLYKWNVEDANPKIELLKKVADYFNVSIDYLIGRTNKREIANHDSLTYSDEENAKYETLAAHIEDDVTEDEMDEIKNYIEFIKSKRH